MEDDNDNGNENRNYHELVMNERRERERKLSRIGHEFKKKRIKQTIFQ